MRIITIFGTRPEAIKMAPLVNALKSDSRFEAFTLVTAQHREMLDQILDTFDIVPDFDLNLMKHGQTLIDILDGVLRGVDAVIKQVKPDLILVHGDTSTAYASALAGFYNQVKVGHIEAGLRSFDKYSPFPEEMNRVLISKLADYHFAPTELNRQNLLKDGIDDNKIFVTGNTVIDALYSVVDKDYVFEDSKIHDIMQNSNRKILVTVHRRENFGDGMINIFRAILDIVNKYNDVEVIFPMHKNPKIREIINEYLANNSRIHLVEPMEYTEFSNLMSRCYLILSDSGGIQEEAPALGTPVVVLRRETERPEGVEAGTIVLAGVEYSDVYSITSNLLDDEDAYNKMQKSKNPYGDGTASSRIIDVISTLCI